MGLWRFKHLQGIDNPLARSREDPETAMYADAMSATRNTSSDPSIGGHRSRLTPERLAVPRKAVRTRQAILDAATRFLGDQPFRDLTVALLMTEAGASRPTFYLYFEDLYDLMRTLLVECQEAILAAAAPWFTTEEDPQQALRQSLRGLVQVGRQRGTILRAAAEAAPFDVVLEKAWNEFLSNFDAAVASRIEAQQTRGLIAPLPARAIAVALNRMDAFVLIKEFGSPRHGDPELVYQSLCRIWLSTLYGPTR